MLWTVGMSAAIGLAAIACSTTNSKPPETGAQDSAENVLAPVPAPTEELGTVYFELDSAALGSEGRASLQRDAQRIRSNPDWGMVTIEGHCDERGSDEYNLALGERRADVVAQYLSDLGVPSDRLNTRTLGELQPAAPGHDELAWQANRRAQLQISSSN